MRRIRIGTDTIKAILRHPTVNIDPLYANPRSLYSSGSVERRPAVEDPRERVTHDAVRAVERNLRLSAAVEGEVITDIRAPRPKSPGVGSLPRPVVDDPAAAIRRVLQSPASLRTAIILKEVLDPPLALRGERKPEV